MQTTERLDRRPSPAKRPFGLAMLDGLIWNGSWESDRIYAVDPKTWKVEKEIQAPGRPYGIAVAGDEFRVVVAHGEEEDRYLYRMTRDGVDLASKTPCPDLTGSHLAIDGSTIYLGQMGFRRILQMKPDYTIVREIVLPTASGGFAIGPDRRFYMISADSEFEKLEFGTLDVAQDRPAFESLRALPEEARSLLYDGTVWWTSLRDADAIASFTV